MISMGCSASRQVEALERLVSLSKPIRAGVLLALREATKAGRM